MILFFGNLFFFGTLLYLPGVQIVIMTLLVAQEASFVLE